MINKRITQLYNSNYITKEISCIIIGDNVGVVDVIGIVFVILVSNNKTGIHRNTTGRRPKMGLLNEIWLWK